MAMTRWWSAGLAAMALLAAGCEQKLEQEQRRALTEEVKALGVEEFSEAPTTKLPPQPTLADYLRVAAIDNPGLRAAFHAWQAALEQAPQVRALPEPKLSYTRYIEEVETRVGAQKNRFALMQMVPWPEKLASKYDAAVRKALAAKYMFDAKKLAVFYRVRKAYQEYYFLSRSIAVVKDSISFLRNLERSLETRFQAGVAKNSSLIQTQVEQGKLEDRLKTLQAMRTPLTARLNAAIGRSPEKPLPWPRAELGRTPPLAEKRILAILRRNNPGLEAARQQVRAAAAGVRLAQSQYLPDFGVGASVVDTRRRTDMNPEGNGKDPVMLTLQMSLPLWWGKYAAGVRAARARQAQARERVRDLANQLTVDLRLAFFNYQDAARKLDLFRNTLVPKAEQGLAAAQTAFSGGKASFLDLIDAERTLLELRLMAERAVVDRRIRLADLERLAGRDLRRTTKADDGR